LKKRGSDWEWVLVAGGWKRKDGGVKSGEAEEEEEERDERKEKEELKRTLLELIREQTVIEW
jgi:hypothetical protein